MSEAVLIAMIGAVGLMVTALLSAITTLLVTRMQTELLRTKAAVVETQAAIVTLEKNTNSIKDALVKVTAEAEFAKGLKAGEGAALVGPQGPAGPQGKTGPEGPKGKLW